MHGAPLAIRKATGTADLDALNAVVEACLMEWNLPTRVKRLALGSYLYGESDLTFMQFLLAVTTGGQVVGVAALELAAERELPARRSGLLLHGLYVSPEQQRQGIGSRLVKAALAATRSQGLDGLLVKAQREAIGFFQSSGFRPLPLDFPDTDYANRWWKAAACNV